MALTTAKCKKHEDCQVTTGAGGETHVQQSVKISRSEYAELKRRLEKMERKLQAAERRAAKLSDRRILEEARFNKLLWDASEARAREQKEHVEAMRAVERAVGDEGWATKHDAKSIAGVAERAAILARFSHDAMLEAEKKYTKLAVRLTLALDKATEALQSEVAVKAKNIERYEALSAEWRSYAAKTSAELEAIRVQLKDQHDNFWLSPEATFATFKALEHRFKKVEQAQIDLARHVEKRAAKW